MIIYATKKRMFQFPYDEFITVLLGDSGDVNCWESLADAYLARGSYTAALKAFEKVLTINHNSEYPR